MHFTKETFDDGELQIMTQNNCTIKALEIN